MTAVLHLAAMVLLLLLQGWPVTAAIRRTDTDRVHAVRQPDATVMNKTTEGAATEIVEGLRRILDTFELQPQLSKYT